MPRGAERIVVIVALVISFCCYSSLGIYASYKTYQNRNTSEEDKDRSEKYKGENSNQ